MLPVPSKVGRSVRVCEGGTRDTPVIYICPEGTFRRDVHTPDVSVQNPGTSTVTDRAVHEWSMSHSANRPVFGEGSVWRGFRTEWSL